MKDDRQLPLCSVVGASDLDWTPEEGWSAPGRVIGVAIERAGDGGTLTEEALLSIWKELYGQDPTADEKWDLLNYAKVLKDTMAANRGS